MTEQKTVWPSHYTSADVAMIEKAKQWIADREYTQAALARLARISSSSLNQIIKGVYATSPTKMLAAVESAMRHADETSGHIIAPVETSVFRLANIACDMARRYRNFAVLSAFVGTGKTFAVKHYAATHPNTYVIEATPTMTPQSLTKLLARMVVGLEKGSIADKFDQVVASLKNTDSLIIVDEAETLTPHQLHTIRRIRDLANIGIVLCGTEHLSGLIKPQHGQFDQIRSRVGMWPKTIERITRDDADDMAREALAEAGELDDEVLEALWAYCDGSARVLLENLVPAVKDYGLGKGALTAALVEKIAKTVLFMDRPRAEGGKA